MKIIKHFPIILVVINIVLCVLAYQGSFEAMDLLPVVFGISTVLLALTSIWFRRTAWPTYRLVGLALVVVSALAVYHVHFNVYKAGQMEASRSASMQVLTDSKAPALTYVQSVNSTELFDFEMFTAGNTYTILNFWATWCAPCLEEMPVLQEFHQAYKDRNVGVVGFTDYRGDQTKAMKRIGQTLKKVKVGYPILIDSTTAVRAAYNADILPATVLLDNQGRVVDFQIGIEGAKKVMHYVREQLDPAQ